MLADLVAGRGSAGVALEGSVAVRPEGGGLVVDGTWEVVLGGAVASTLLVPLDAGGPDGQQWAVLAAV